MAINDQEYGVWLETIEQTLSDKNIEDYLTQHPEDAGTWIDWPNPPYAAQITAGLLMFRDIIIEESGLSTVGAVLTTGLSGQPDEGRATLNFPEMTTPVVTASVLDPTVDNTFYHVVIESVTSTSATVRVGRSVSVTASGFEVMSVPQLAAEHQVHVRVHDAG